MQAVISNHEVYAATCIAVGLCQPEKLHHFVHWYIYIGMYIVNTIFYPFYIIQTTFDSGNFLPRPCVPHMVVSAVGCRHYQLVGAAYIAGQEQRRLTGAPL